MSWLEFDLIMISPVGRNHHIDPMVMVIKPWDNKYKCYFGQLIQQWRLIIVETSLGSAWERFLQDIYVS